MRIIWLAEFSLTVSSIMNNKIDHFETFYRPGDEYTNLVETQTTFSVQNHV